MFVAMENVQNLLFLVPVILFVHEMEEWNVHQFHLDQYDNAIPGETHLSCRLWLFFLSIFGFVWTTGCFLISPLALSCALMFLLIDFSLLNSLQHLALSLKIRRYNPGLWFGGIVALLGNIWVLAHFVHYAILPGWAIVLLLLPIIPFLVDTALSSRKNQTPKMIEWILTFSTHLEKVMTQSPR
ncbi:MAG: hypothetical protein CENE_01650 [Candidatus Celerinatantimonas neptuna]|nr:MAG: hypothetical protein CENE_01650 [Candidatus Celerinatantimonas neptuna]